MLFTNGGILTLFNFEKFWQHFNDEMRARFNEVAYNAWFKNTKPISYNQKTHELKIQVQNPVAKGYWEKNLSSQLIQSAYGYAGVELLPVFQISEDSDTPERIVTPEPQHNLQTTPTRAPQREFAKDLKLNEKYTFDNFVQGAFRDPRTQG